MHYALKKAPRSGMTTAESPEPLTFQHSEFIMYKQKIPQEIVGPAARHFGVFCVFCGSQIISVIRVFCGFKNFVSIRAIRGSK